MFKLLSKTVSVIVSPTLKQGAKPFQNYMKMSSIATYETLAVSVPKENVFHVELNRPKKVNSLNHALWMDITKCFQDLQQNADCRVIVLSGAGKLFCAGLDFEAMMSLGSEVQKHDDIARRAKVLLPFIKRYQVSMSALEECTKPVLAAVHSACIGAGVDMITAADMRYCTKDAWFQVKEIEFGFAADVGTLQRLPKVIGSTSLARELCFTARKLPASEALESGLVSKVFEDKESMIAGVVDIAEVIAKKSPVGTQTVKASLNFSRDHTVQEGLDHIAILNQLMLQSEDFQNAVAGSISKQPNVVFSKL